jgi:hypothetical protein
MYTNNRRFHVKQFANSLDTMVIILIILFALLLFVAPQEAGKVLASLSGN